MSVLYIDPGHLEAYYSFGVANELHPFETPFLDRFNRADENPLDGGGNWHTRAYPDGGGPVYPLKLVGNKVQNALSGSWFSYGIWHPTTFTDCEAYCKLGTSTWWQGVGARVQPGPGTDLMTGYVMLAHPNGSILIEREGPTLPRVAIASGPDPVPHLVAGDSIGIRCIGSTITGWYKRAADCFWTLALTATDTTYPSGLLALECGSNAQLDDFSGGVPHSGPKMWPFTEHSGVTHNQPNFIPDLSGNGRHLGAIQESAVAYGCYPPTFGVRPGAGLSPDDGCVQFNLGYYIWTGPFSANMIGLYGPAVGEFSDGVGGGVNTGCTMSFWVKYLPSVIPPDSWAPGTTPSLIPFISTRYRGFSAVPYDGWAWWINSGDGTIRYTTAQNQGFPSGSWDLPDKLVENVWTHIVMRLTPIITTGPGSSHTWLREFFVNDEPVLTIEGNVALVAPTVTTGYPLTFGGGMLDDLRFCITRCAIDEWAHWSHPVDVSAHGIVVSFTENTHDTPFWTQVDDPVGVA